MFLMILSYYIIRGHSIFLEKLNGVLFFGVIFFLTVPLVHGELDDLVYVAVCVSVVYEDMGEPLYYKMKSSP